MTMNDEPQKRQMPAFSPFGFFLVMLGAGLLLVRFSGVRVSRVDVWWLAVGMFGLVLTVYAALHGKRGGAFWGPFLLFLSAAVFLRRSGFIDPMLWDWPAALSLVLGASFLILYFFDPRRIGVLVPVILFGGAGVLYYLWWWDILDWYEVRYYVRTYWPVLLILWGLGFMIRPSRRVKT